MNVNIEFLIAVSFIVLSIFGFAVFYFLINNLWPLIKEQLIADGREREAEFIQRIVDTAVLHAEQLGEENAEKKRMAFEFVIGELNKYGLSLDPSTVDSLIEAAVYQLLNQFKPEVADIN